MLTPEQNQQIMALLKDAGLKYEEVYQELVDHYSVAIEVKIENGVAFEQALDEVHEDFGGSKNVKYIQDQYKKEMFKFYRNLHWRNLKSHFQWPQCLLTLVMAGMVYSLSLLLKGGPSLLIGLSVLALVPFVLSMFYFVKFRNNGTYSKKSAKANMLIGIGGYGLNFLNILIFVPGIFINETTGKELLLLYPAFLSIIITLYILQMLSFFKTVEGVKFKTT